MAKTAGRDGFPWLPQYLKLRRVYIKKSRRLAFLKKKTTEDLASPNPYFQASRWTPFSPAPTREPFTHLGHWLGAVGTWVCSGVSEEGTWILFSPDLPSPQTSCARPVRQLQPWTFLLMWDSLPLRTLIGRIPFGGKFFLISQGKVFPHSDPGLCCPSHPPFHHFEHWQPLILLWKPTQLLLPFPLDTMSSPLAFLWMCSTLSLSHVGLVGSSFPFCPSKSH